VDYYYNILCESKLYLSLIGVFDLKSTINSETKEVILFFILTVAWTWLFWSVAALITNGVVSIEVSADLFTAFGGLGPIIFALILTFRANGKDGVIRLLKRGANYKFNKRWWAPIILLVPLIFIASYYILGAIETVPALDGPRFLEQFPTKFIYFFFLVAVAEEFGWRGFALDRLQTRFRSSRYTAVISSIVLGIVWGLWHLPFFFTSGTSQEGWPLALFMWLVITVTILFTWLHNNTGGSVLTALFFHTMFNLAVNFIPIFLLHFYYPSASNDLSFLIVNAITTSIVLLVIAYWGPKNLSRQERRETSTQ